MTRPSSTADNFPGDEKDLNWEAIGKSGSRDAMNSENGDGDPDARPLDAVDPLELAGATASPSAWADPTKAKPHTNKGADGVSGVATSDSRAVPIPTTRKKG